MGVGGGWHLGARCNSEIYNTRTDINPSTFPMQTQGPKAVEPHLYISCDLAIKTYNCTIIK